MSKELTGIVERAGRHLLADAAGVFALTVLLLGALGLPALI